MLDNLDAMHSLDLAIGLEELVDMQRVVSGLIPGHISDEPTNDQIMFACFALQGEIFELAQELGWKSWKKNKELTTTQQRVIAEEFADILAFLGYLMVLMQNRTGLTTTQLGDAYFEKSSKNIRRFLGKSGEEGYEQVAESRFERTESPSDTSELE